MPRIAAAAALACAVAAFGDGPPTAPLTAEELFRAAPLGKASLSPDGRHLGAIVTDEGDVKSLVIFDLAQKDFKPSALFGAGKFEVVSFDWLDDRRILFSVAKNKVYSWGLYSAGIDDLGRHTPIDIYDAMKIIGVPKARPGRVLVWITQAARDEGRPGPLVELDADRHPSASRSRGLGDAVALARSYPPPRGGTVIGWDAGRDGELALCETWLNARVHFNLYLPASGAWREIDLPLGARPMGMDPDPHFLWAVVHAQGNGYELRRMNVDTGAMDAPVLTDPDYDIGAGRLYFSGRSHGLAGVTYTRREQVTAWFLQGYAAAQATINQHRPGTVSVLVDHDLQEEKFLFACTAPGHPGSLELLDLRAKTLRSVADAAPWLRGKALRPVKPFTFKTRDGVALEGYLTLPQGASVQHPVPLVVLCHGGPWVRDTSEYNPEVQFLASRGYAVLQPNYRGSAGYSPEISHERRFDFRRMHDDVTDATRAEVGTGMVDAGRVAIMGGSFGGYLAVSGVAFENGLYRCAITECGVFDWAKQIRSKSYVGRPGEYEQLTDELGKPGQDRARLQEISPLEHADQIHVPVLIAHGTEDNIVDVAQSRKLASELKHRGVPYETFYRGLEGHGFFGFKDRVDFYHRVEAFLAANLGGATLTPAR
jgi:acetyl esterase/lipase